MKIFLDTADYAVITRWYETGLIDGVTTNPSHLSKAGASAADVAKKIALLCKNGDVSIEVTKESPHDVYNQAHEIAALAPNVTVKIPCHLNYYPIIHRLVKEGVRLNITLVFTLLQGLMMAKLGARYISPFVGRWDDIDVEGMDILYELRSALDTYGYETQLLAASLRHVRHVHEAVMAGADVVTLPPAVLEKMCEHPLTNQGITQFTEDWKKVGNLRFP